MAESPFQASFAMVDATGAALLEALDASWGLTWSKSEARARYEIWEAQVRTWKDLGQRAQDAGRLAEWQRLGANLAANAQDLADYMKADDVSMRAHRLVFELPASMKTAAAAALEGAKDAAVSVVGAAGEVASSAAWEVAKVAAVLAGVLALASFIFAKSGVSIGAGPIRVGK